MKFTIFSECNDCFSYLMIPVSIYSSSPPSASPDCKLAHNCVNYRVVSARYMHAFCVMLELSSQPTPPKAALQSLFPRIVKELAAIIDLIQPVK